jgi:hypothetical protein
MLVSFCVFPARRSTCSVGSVAIGHVRSRASRGTGRRHRAGQHDAAGDHRRRLEQRSGHHDRRLQRDRVTGSWPVMTSGACTLAICQKGYCGVPQVIRRPGQRGNATLQIGERAHTPSPALIAVAVTECFYFPVAANPSAFRTSGPYRWTTSPFSVSVPLQPTIS